MRIIGAARMEEEYGRNDEWSETRKRTVLAGEDPDERRIVNQVDQGRYGAFDPLSSDRAEAATMRRDPPLAMRHAFKREDALSSPSNARSPRADLVATPNSFTIRGASSMPIATKVFGNISKVFNAPGAAVDTGPRCSSANIPRVPSGARAGVALMKDVLTAPCGSKHVRSNRWEPHIFISANNLPAQPSMVKHVRRFFLGYGIQTVLMDAAGYYITFVDTADGRRRLADCAQRTKHAVMFRQYGLEPKVFYDNKEVTNFDRLNAASTVERWRSSCPSIPTRAKQSNTTAEQTVSDEIHNTHEKSFAPRPLSLSPQVPSAAHPVHGNSKSQLRSVVAQIGTSQSPAAELTTPKTSAIRQPNDGTSSVHSGTTSSSRSKVAQCRVCRGLGGAMSLCRSCVRNYHTQCRPQGSVKGSTKLKIHTYWQCADCVRKGKPQLYKALDRKASGPAELREVPSSTMQTDLPIHESENDGKSRHTKQSNHHTGGQPIARSARKASIQQTASSGSLEHGAQTRQSEQQSQLRDGGKSIVAERLNAVHVPARVTPNKPSQPDIFMEKDAASGSHMLMSGVNLALGERNHVLPRERIRAAEIYKQKLKRNAEHDDLTLDGHDQQSDSRRADAQRVDTQHRNAPAERVVTASDLAAQVQLKPIFLHEAGSTSLPVALNHRLPEDDDSDTLNEAQNLIEQSFTSNETATKEMNTPKKFTFTRVKRREPIALTLGESQEHAMVSTPAQPGVFDHDVPPELARTLSQPASGINTLRSGRSGEHGHTLTTPDLAIQGSRPTSPSPSNSFPQPQARRINGFARAKRTKIVSMKCNTCGKSVPFNPSGRSKCTACKEKSAQGAPIPEQCVIPAETKLPQSTIVETVRFVPSNVPIPDVASKDMHSMPSQEVCARIGSEAAAVVSVRSPDHIEDCPGAMAAKQSASTAAVTKRFPIESGSTTGTRVVVENSAPGDDDQDNHEGTGAISGEKGTASPEAIDSTEATEPTETNLATENTVAAEQTAVTKATPADDTSEATAVHKTIQLDGRRSTSTTDSPKLYQFTQSTKVVEHSEADVERPPSAREASEMIYSNGDGEAIAANANRKKKRAERKDQRAVAVDHNDLGNSFRRPPGTYLRLIGMALCAANDNRATTQWVTQWIVDNIPNYALDEGTWAKGVHSTLCLNASGRSGRVIVTSGTLKPLDTGSRAKKFYELLPGLAEELEHWDETLQQPRSPMVTRQSHALVLSLGKAPKNNIVPHKGPSTGRLMETSNNKTVPQKRSSRGEYMGRPTAKMMRTSMALFNDAMVLDHDDFVQSCRHEDDEPGYWTGDTMRKRELATSSLRPEVQQDGGAEIFGEEPSLSRELPDQCISAAIRSGKFDHDVSADQPSGTLQTTALVPDAHDIRVLTAADIYKEDLPCFDDEKESALLEMIREDHRIRNSSSKSLFVDRPQYNPNYEAKRQAKIIEISERPRRKQLFGKPVGYSVLDWTEFFEGRCLAASMNASLIKKNVQPPLLGGDSTSIQEFDSLKEFLSLPDDLVPAIMDKELVYRHKGGNKRAVYRTGI